MRFPTETKTSKAFGTTPAKVPKRSKISVERTERNLSIARED